MPLRATVSTSTASYRSLNRILALKDLGFSLEEIGRLLDDDLSVEQMRGMLKLREAEARQRMQQEAERLERIEVRLRQIEQEKCMSKYDVVIKSAEQIKIASVRDVVPTPPDQGPLWEELGGYLALNHIRPSGACFTLYYDDEFKERDWDLEVCEQIDVDLERVAAYQSADFAARRLPGLHDPPRTVHHDRRSLQRPRPVDHGQRLPHHRSLPGGLPTPPGERQPDRSRDRDGDPVPGGEGDQVAWNKYNLNR